MCVCIKKFGWFSCNLIEQMKLYWWRSGRTLYWQLAEFRFEAHMEVHVGSIDEEDDEQGIAHMIEHVAFLGSKKREKLLGTGARSNAYTDFHHTVFHIHSPTSTKVVLVGFSIFIGMHWYHISIFCLSCFYEDRVKHFISQKTGFVSSIIFFLADLK